MADPITWGAVAKLAPTALAAVGMGVDAVGGSADAAQNREDAARVGMDVRNQNARLMRGPGGMPAPTASLQGYGPAPTPGGQYAPIQPEFTDGAVEQGQVVGRVPPEAFLQQPVLTPQAMMGEGPVYQPAPSPQGYPPPPPMTDAETEALGWAFAQSVMPQLFGGATPPLFFDDGPQQQTPRR